MGPEADVITKDAPADQRRLTHRRYWIALYRRDVAKAEAIVEQCLKEWKPQHIYLRLFEPALSFSGTMWAKGCITYQDEHFVTHHTLRFLRRVRHRFVPAETYGPLAMATASGQESHLIGLRMVCDFLQADDWRIHWLSSNDRATVRQGVRRLRPQALLISIGLDTGLTTARRVIADARRADFNGVVVVGGAAINRDPSRVQAIGADMTAPNGFVLARQLRPRMRPPEKRRWA